MAAVPPPCKVEELLMRPFKSRSNAEQVDIVMRGRPCPPIPSLPGEEGRRPLDLAKEYEQVPWLAGCECPPSLHCWPCLLFTDKLVTFDTSSKRRAHQRSVSHAQRALKLATFVPCAPESETPPLYAKEALRRHIDCAVYAVRCGLPLGGGNYAATLAFLGEFDPELGARLERPGPFRDQPERIRDGLVRAMAAAVCGRVRAELREAPFVSFLLDEIQTQDVRLACMAARYVGPDGRPRERFVCTRDLLGDRTAEGMFAQFAKVVDDLGVTDKVVSHSHCGRLIDITELERLCGMIRSKCGRAHLVNSSDRNLLGVVDASLSHLPSSRLPLFRLSRLAAFLSGGARASHFRAFLAQEHPDALPPSNWRPDSRSVLALRREILEYLDCLVAEGDDCLEAEGCIPALESFEGCFHLAVAADLEERLEDITQPSDLALNAKQRFEAAWDFATTEAEEEGHPPHPPRKRDRPSDPPRLAYSRRHAACIAAAKACARLYAACEERTRFVRLADPSRFHRYALAFPERELELLEANYPGCFDIKRLHAELSALYSQRWADGGYAHVGELVRGMRASGMDVAIPEAYRLARLCLTLPLSVEQGRDWSATLANWAGAVGASTSEGGGEELAYLRAEAALLVDCRERTDFLDQVAAEFAAGEGMPEFAASCLTHPTTTEKTKKKPPARPTEVAPVPVALGSPTVEDAGPQSPVSMVEIKEETPVWNEPLKMETEDDYDDESGRQEFAFVEVSGDPLSLDNE